VFRISLGIIVILGVSLAVPSYACESVLNEPPFKTTSVCHSRDIKRVYLGRSDGQIDVHNLENGKPLYSFKRRDRAWGEPLELVLSHNEHVLFAYYSNNFIVRFFNRAEQKLVLAFHNPDVFEGDIERFKKIVEEHNRKQQ
jgi:WD40 repeat protein